MLKQAYVFLAVIIMAAFSHAAFAVDAIETNAVETKAADENDSDRIENTNDLEHKILKLSGFLSLPQQVKFRAQFLTNNSVNRAQQFAIATQLSKQWSQKVWKSRLLTLVQGYSIEDKKALLQQLEHPIFQMSQIVEREAMSDLQGEAYSEYMVKLQRHQPTLLRSQMIADLDSTSRFSEIMGLIQNKVIKETQSIVLDWKPIESEGQSLQKEVEGFLFYAYRKTPNAELKRIINQFKQLQIQQFYLDTSNIIQRL